MVENKKITIKQIFWYFVLFSILGLIIETVYGYATMGVVESRKGLIWGPFCPVYGVGATLLILILNNVEQKKYWKLFVYGILIGAVVEYLLSYGLEAFYGIRFWDYSYTGKDINGRICTLYSVFWGVLAILLMKFVKPCIDKIISKIPNKIQNPIEIILFIFLVIDVLVTVWSINTYEVRVISNYYGEEIKTSSILWVKKVEEEYFTNERIQKIFPNLRIKTREGNQVFVRDLIQDSNHSNQTKQ